MSTSPESGKYLTYVDRGSSAPTEEISSIFGLYESKNHLQVSQIDELM
ncbi:hypothetical protein ES707_06258 [subsurface metagenome]